MANHERARSVGGDAGSLPNKGYLLHNTNNNSTSSSSSNNKTNNTSSMPPRLRRPSSSTYPTLQLPSDIKSLSEPGTRQPSQAQIWIPCSPSPSSAENSPFHNMQHHYDNNNGSSQSSHHHNHNHNYHHHHHHHNASVGGQSASSYSYSQQQSAGTSSAQSTPPTLYSPATTALSSPGSRPQLFYPSPYLHHTQRQPVKETHMLDIDFDPISGRKSINHYEIINEIGRGVHGKVKLGRNLENGEHVAIKIIDRTSRPRLGRQGLNKVSSQEEKVRREIAILKKCRHKNVVRLLEVIDDPASKKVYLVLEFVELGEIKWRQEGDKRVAMREARRVERLRRLALGEPLDQDNDDPEAEKRQRRRRKRRRQREKLRKAEEKASAAAARVGIEDDDHDGNEHMWSLELGGQTEESDEEVSDFSSDESDDETDGAAKNGSIGGHSLGSHRSQADHIEEMLSSSLTRNLSFSTTTTASEFDSELKFVPALTLQQARSTFRDTVLGLEYLHYQGIIHRDIKPANLLWNKDHHVKISDFGVSYLGPGQDDENAPELDQGDIELAKTVGTPAFFAPELCYVDFTKPRPPITAAIDVWALGVTLYCLVFARCPFLADGEYELFNRICNQQLFIPETRLRPETATPQSSRPGTSRRTSAKKLQTGSGEVTTYEPINADLRDLLEKLLTKDQKDRITLTEVKRHPWVLSDLEDPIAWIEDSDPRRVGPVEVSKEEVDAAVIPASILGRVKSGIKKVVGGITGVVGLRRRAHSAVAVTTIPNLNDNSDASSLHPDSAAAGADKQQQQQNEVPESEAEKALRKKSLGTLCVGPPHPSPLRRATSAATDRGKDRAASTPPGMATGPFAPPPLPFKMGIPNPPAPAPAPSPPTLPTMMPQPAYQQPQQQNSQQSFDTVSSSSHRSSGIFASRFGMGRIVRSIRSRDLIGDTAISKEDGSGETSTSSNATTTFRDIRPVTSGGDIVHRQSADALEFRKKGKDRDAAKEKSGSLRSWGGALKRSSRQSFDSLMRLSSATSNQSGSPQPSVPSSPMPSMPVSPIDGHRMFFPNEETALPPAPTSVPSAPLTAASTPAPSPPMPATQQQQAVQEIKTDKRRFIRSVSPTGSRRRNSFCPPVEEEDCIRSPEDELFIASLRDRSGDDSTITRRRYHDSTWGHSAIHRGGARSQGNASPVSMISPDISPRTRSPAAPSTPSTRHQQQPQPLRQHRHTSSDKVVSCDRSGGCGSALVTSSSDERFATSSLSNSTSYPSILSASSSLSTEEQWSTYNAAASPKRQLSGTDGSPSLASPRVLPAEVGRPTLPTMKPELFADDSTKVSPLSSAHPDDYEPDDEDDCDSDSDDDDDRDGFFLNLSTKKNIRSSSVSIAEIQRNRERMS